jgi:arylsulfatase A-like enzyme
MHVTDWFTTILRIAGLEAPTDRVIDGVEQLGWLTGHTDRSQREGYIYWMGPQMYGVSGITSSWCWSPSATCKTRRPGCPRRG